MLIFAPMKTQIKKAAVAIAILCGTGLSAQTIQDAIRYTENEQYDKAKAAFKTLLAKEPTNGDIYFYFGDLLLKDEETQDSAKIIFQKGVDINATNPLVHVGLGRYYMYTGNMELGQKELGYAKSLLITQAGKKGTDLAIPRQVTVNLEIAETYIWAMSPNPDEAIAICNAAEKLDAKAPSAEIYLVRGDAKLRKDPVNASPAIEDYNKAAKADPKSCRAYVRIGAVYAGGKNMNSAIGYYNLASKTDASFAPAYRLCGEAQYLIGKFDSAAYNFEKYLSLNDDCHARYRYTAFLYLGEGYDKAIVQGRKTIACDSSIVVLYRIVGNSYIKKANPSADSAMLFFNLFFKKQKQFSRPALVVDDYLGRAKAYSLLKQDSLAVIDIENALKLDTSRKDLYFDLGGKYFSMKKYDKAAYYYKKKIDINPAKSSVSDWNAYGVTLLRLKDFKGADSAFIKLLAMDSLSTYGWVGRGRANAGLDPDGTKGLARPYYEKFYSLASVDKEKNKKDLITASLYLASYHLVNKNYACSKAYYQYVKELEPNNEKAKNGLELAEIKAATAADITTCNAIKK
jgi:tetratricopeptide (TPR) repeat protein